MLQISNLQYSTKQNMTQGELDTVASVELHYVSAEKSREHAVPSRRVVESLEGIKKVLDVITTLSEDGQSGRDGTGKKSKAPVEVMVRTPKRGSFCLPVDIVVGDQDLFSSTSEKELQSKFWRIVSAVKDNNTSDFMEVLPDVSNQQKVLTAIKRIFNSFPQDSSLVLKDTTNRYQISSNDIEKPYEKICSRINPELGLYPVVIGEVSRINFRNRRVTLTIPDTKQSVSIPYMGEHERILFDSARKLVEVHCDVYKDGLDRIRKLENLSRFVPVDSTDMKIEDLLPPFLEPKNIANSKVNIELTDNESVYCGTYDDLDILAGGYSRASIESEIRSEISVLWKDLVREKYTKLSPYAQSLKEKLHHSFKEKLAGN